MVMRGCRFAMSMKAARRSFHNRSSSAVLSRAVRAGQVSRRTKITMIIVATMSVNAIGHVTRPEFADFNIGRWTLCVERFFQALIEQEHDHEQEERGRRLSAKKVPPPTPDGREGRLFPPEQSSKTLRLLNEL